MGILTAGQNLWSSKTAGGVVVDHALEVEAVTRLNKAIELVPTDEHDTGVKKAKAPDGGKTLLR